MTPIRIGKTRIDPAALLATLALGTLGGGVGHLLGLPLGYLMGSLLLVAIWSVRGWRVLGQPIHLPQPLRMCFIPIVGVGIGGAFTPGLFQEAAGWWPSVLGLFLFIPLAHFISYRIYRAGGLSPVTAYFGGVPGGLIESVVMGEEAGADVALLTLIQFLRLILTIVSVPLIFLALTGHSVGSSAGVAMAGAENPLEALDILVLLVAAAGGYALGRVLHFPAPILTGPLAASALAHLLGLTDAVPPGWTLIVTQIVVGTGLGARFTGMGGAMLRRGVALGLVSVGASLILAFAFAEVLHLTVDMPIAAVFLAFAPGGVTEMSLIALSLHISVVFVSLHHVLRILLAISFARLFASRVTKG
ncbi:AbrB family transcriptional regulator [Pseudorhodobacter sp. E13]|uniref:AbrB family transcriptional regulator n=1 Tax=Pseudorhodobacter sp. E13 TaxID=2487931 RepID=UPI000F8EE9E7|nr:AbrB family transcriptional regulator [Pseudorhodobacter sp. E13]RUS60881.1 AbrB family transcriptional regulator [Pseudorhodobacter sp. E13]